MNDATTGDTTTTYDALDFDGTERRANYRVIALREDILHFLERREAAALLFQIIYRWQTEYKRAEALKEIDRRRKAGQAPLAPEEVEEMMWVHMSYNDFVRETGGAVAYNTVIRTLDYLVNGKQALVRRENHDPHFPDYEYRINVGLVRIFLKALPVAPAFIPKGTKKPTATQMGTVEEDSTHLGTAYTHLGSHSTHLGTAYTHLGTGLYPNGGTSQDLSQDHTETPQDSSQEDRAMRADASPALPAAENTLIDFTSRKAASDARLRAVLFADVGVGDGDAGDALPEEEDISLQETVKAATPAALAALRVSQQQPQPNKQPDTPAGDAPTPPAREQPTGAPSIAAFASSPSLNGSEARRVARTNPAVPVPAAAAKQAPLSMRDVGEGAARPLGEKTLRARYEAHFWQLIEEVRRARGLKPPTYGKSWKALRDNQEGISAFYADEVSDQAITAGYCALLESGDAWLRNNFTALAFFKRLQGLLDADAAPRHGHGNGNGNGRGRNRPRDPNTLADGTDARYAI